MKLDIGCGHAPKGDVNIDLFIDATDHRNRTAKDDIPLNTKNIPNFIRTDANYLPFRPCTFTKIFMYEVLEHLANPSNGLKNIHKVLAENGVLEFSVPNMMYWRCIIRWIVKEKITISARRHINGWRLPEIENLLQEVGFKIREIGYVDVGGDVPSFFANVLPRITKHSMLVKAVKVACL